MRLRLQGYVSHLQVCLHLFHPKSIGSVHLLLLHSLKFHGKSLISLLHPSTQISGLHFQHIASLGIFLVKKRLQIVSLRLKIAHMMAIVLRLFGPLLLQPLNFRLAVRLSLREFLIGHSHLRRLMFPEGLEATVKPQRLASPRVFCQRVLVFLFHIADGRLQVLILCQRLVECLRHTLDLLLEHLSHRRHDLHLFLHRHGALHTRGGHPVMFHRIARDATLEVRNLKTQLSDMLALLPTVVLQLLTSCERVLVLL
mmetsp:Transcript_32374/g.86829  ORF Transcript_32374/g.86829 Transcript_32374/m.86829 type:complete len:255 (+) Transcript_32374:307-1071(+)